MSIFKKASKNKSNEEPQKRLNGGDYGIHFPWGGFIFLIMGIMSEITDIYWLRGTIGRFNVGISNDVVDIISTITGILCFGSMAGIGYQDANKRIEYKTRKIEISIWFAIGILITSMRLFLAITSNMDSPNYLSKVATESFMALLQFLLYISSGFLSYMSSKQLFNGKLYEYLMAKHAYEKLLDELSDKKEYISGGIHDLSSYPEYVERLKESRNDVLKNVGQYNKATRAICEAKMAVVTDPDQMDDMYERAKLKEIKENRQWTTAIQD